jgi:hypothetical protein
MREKMDKQELKSHKPADGSDPEEEEEATPSLSCWEILAAACLLDPRTKDLRWMEEGEQSMAKKAVATLASQVSQVTETTESVSPDDVIPVDEEVQPPEKRVCLDHDEDWLDEITATPPASTTRNSSDIDAEVQRYTIEPQIAAKSDPLLWWKEKEATYGWLAPVAKHVLAVPASSVPAERIFSLSGNIVTNKRTRLTSSNVDALIFLAKNIK